jgi:Glyoxalase-like domain
MRARIRYRFASSTTTQPRPKPNSPPSPQPGPGQPTRIFDPAGLGPAIWFQQVPETKAGKNRLHLDLYPTGRDNALPLERRTEIVESKVAELTALGAGAQRRIREDDPGDPRYYVVKHDPEGNEFCVG